MSLYLRLRLAVKAAFQLGLWQSLLFVVYKSKLKLGLFRKPVKSDQHAAPPMLSALFTLPSAQQIAATIGAHGKSALLEEANEIVNGQARLFGAQPVDLRLDFKIPLVHWSTYENKPAVLDAHFSGIPDVKLIWEPARFGWAFPLGRAYHLTGDERYAEAFWVHFERFERANPLDFGPNWMSGQEIAIRVMVFVWAAQVFAHSRASTAERQHQLARYAAQHAQRILPTLVYARAQNSNHLTTEAAGLLIAGMALPSHPAAKTWLSSGMRWLNWSLENQILEDGEYIQRSTNYQRMLLQLTLFCISAAEEDFLTPRARQNVRQSAFWLFDLTDHQSGQPANMGGNDGAYIFPLAGGGYSDFRPVLQAAFQQLLGFSAYPPGAWDEMSLWFCDHCSHHTAQPSHSISTSTLYGTASWAYLRAVRHQHRPGHADQLHLDLWWRGLNIARDAGSYLYNGAPPWDNQLTTARVHNTITINDQDQMTRARRFLYLDWAQAEIGLERQTGTMQASHDGYCSRFGVIHRRTVRMLDHDNWQIIDWVGGQTQSKPFRVRLHWLLPDWDWKITGNQLWLQSPHGWIKLHVTGANAAHFSLVRAGERLCGNIAPQPIDGWYSPMYSVKLPALAFSVQVDVIQNISLSTTFLFPA